MSNPGKAGQQCRATQRRRLATLLEAAIQQLVALIENDDAKRVQLIGHTRAVLQVVQQTAGRGDQNVDAGRRSQARLLAVDVRPAEHAFDLEAMELGQRLRLGGDLLGELAGRAQHQDRHLLARD